MTPGRSRPRADVRGEADVVVRDFAPSDAAACEAILRGLPEWFGIEPANDAYIASFGRLRTWVAEREEAVCGVVMERRHNPLASEIDFLAVRRDLHGQGIGRKLVEHLEERARADGTTYMQVKTAADEPGGAYARTRAFYVALGYVPLEEFPTGTLWDSDAALQLVKRID